LLSVSLLFSFGALLVASLVVLLAPFALRMSVQIYGMLTCLTGKDLSADFKADLNVEEGKNYNVVVKTYSRDSQTSIKKVMELALLGYCLKDDLKPHFQFVPHFLHRHKTATLALHGACTMMCCMCCNMFYVHELGVCICMCLMLHVHAF
jgi:hypothetical protein